MLQIIEERHGHRTKDVVTSTSAITTQLETHTKTLNELRREVDKTRRFDEQISLTRTEFERLNKTISTLHASLDKLSKQLDERTRAARYLEEQRNIDARRLGELQAELPTLHKAADANLSKLQMLEQQLSQFGKYEIALEEVREDLRRHREHMDFQTAQRERQMKNWTEMAESQARRMDEYEGVMEKYAQQYQHNKRALTSLQDFQERLQREQHQAEELQRLAEERQRSEMDKLQAGYGQRWQKQNMEWKAHADGLQKEIDTLKERSEKITKFNQTIEKQMTLLLQIIEEDVQARAIAAQEWQQHFEHLADG
jgi:chromosome segregation ATPase